MELPRGQLFRISLYYQRHNLVQHPRVKNMLSHSGRQPAHRAPIYEQDFTQKGRIHPIKE